MTLQAKDLMNGDWVRVPDLDKYVRVNAVYPTMICPNSHDDGVHTVIGDEYLQPIPLTPEILEKNGFINKKDKWMQLGNFGNQPLMMWHLKDDMLNYKHQMEIHYSAKKCHLTVMCEYVHQFQHALKLCEIEKEIEL